MSQHDQGDVVMPAQPGPPFVVVQSQLLLELLVVLFDFPAALRQSHQAPQGIGGGKARAAKYEKATLREWAKLGGRPPKKREGE